MLVHFVLCIRLLAISLCLLLSQAAWGQALTASAANQDICEGSAVPLAVVVDGGTPDYTYQWAPAASLSCANCAAPLASPTATTTYSVTVTDALGEMAVAEAIVTVMPPPSISLVMGDTIACRSSATVPITATPLGGNCTLQWAYSPTGMGDWADIPSATQATYMAPTLSSGTHYYRVRYTCPGSGCEAVSNTGSLRVGNDILTNIQPTLANICVGGELTLTVQPSGGAGDCTGQWQASSGQGLVDIPGATEMSYTLPTTLPEGISSFAFSYTCSATGCTQPSSLGSNVVVIHAQPSIQVTPANRTVCAGNPLNLLAIGNGGTGGCAIQWQSSPNETGPWTDVGNPIANTSAGYNVPTQVPGTYYYRALFACQGLGCGEAASNVASVEVVLSDLVAIVIGTDETIFNANNGTASAVVLGGTPPYTFMWSNGATGDQAEGLAPGPYVVTVTDANGCSATDAVLVQPFICYTLTVEGVATDATCGNDGSISAQVSGGAPAYVYAWSNGANTPNITNLPPGNYSVTVTDANGCSATASFTLQGLSPLILTDATITPASCASSSDGSIGPVLVTGGTLPYAYTWPTGNSFSDLVPGLYELTVTDAINCQLLLSFEVGALLTVTAEPTGTVYIGCGGGATLVGTASLDEPGIVLAWHGPDGALLSNQAEIVATLPGTYRFRATNTSEEDCYTETEVVVADFGQVFAQGITSTQLGCNEYEWAGELPPTDYTGTVDYLWTFPDGSTAAQRIISPNQTGAYQLRIGLESCNLYFTRFFDLAADNCATLSGAVVYDLNDNCQYEAHEPGLASWVVRADNGTQAFHALTDSSGAYSFSLPLGDYTVSALLPSDLWEPCGPYEAVLDVEGMSMSLDLVVSEVVECSALSVQLSTPFLRRCFNSNYYVRVCNIGTEVAVAPKVRLDLDELISYQSSQLAPDLVDGQSIYWTLPDLAPGQCFNFWTLVYVSCDSELGQVHCSQATAYSSPLCFPGTAGWSGASLEVAGECIDDVVQFRVTNTGVGDLVSPVNYIVIEDAVMLMQGPGSINSLAVAQTQAFDFEANGRTYTFQVEQAQGHPFEIDSPTVVVEGCGGNGSGTSTGFATQLPTPTTTPAADVLCQVNQGSYDPNDKQALPTGYGGPHYIRAGEEINYLIRFQNTGTDTAFTVIIRDTLSSWLDLATLRLGNASHAYQASIEGSRTLVFTFDNILLPDSTTNQEASQGFVDFDIRTHSDTPLETPLLNSAAIYFDFNEPIITNEVRHTVGEQFIVTAVSTPSYPSDLWQVYPNPSQGAATLQLRQDLPGPKVLTLHDAQGRRLRQLAFTGSELSLHGLSAGLYFLHLANASGQPLGSARLVVLW